MTRRITQNDDDTITVSFTFKPGSSMLESELNLQSAANEALSEATGACLGRFDTDGAPILVGATKLTSKGRVPKRYQTPYGEVKVARHVYQSSRGGRIYCPMEFDARIFRTATPLFAKQAAFKYGNTDSSVAVKDFAEHGRTIARTYVREIGSDVALVAAEKEQAWTPAAPDTEPGRQVRSVSLGVDGTCALMGKKEGWRQVMVGTIALYDEDGERLHTTYVAAAPERGKGEFFERMDRELAVIKKAYPDARYAGVADGAADHWPWLEERTTWQATDFWHVSEYVNAASAAMAKGEAAAKLWAEQACHRLKHESGAAREILKEMEARLSEGGFAKAAKEPLRKAVTYFTNQIERMDYALLRSMDLPIGSGVTEAACKCIVKARLCGSGMRWDSKGASEVLRLRTMIKSDGRWGQFWDNVSRYGFSRITAPKRTKREKSDQSESGKNN